MTVGLRTDPERRRGLCALSFPIIFVLLRARDLSSLGLQSKGWGAVSESVILSHVLAIG